MTWRFYNSFTCMILTATQASCMTPLLFATLFNLALFENNQPPFFLIVVGYNYFITIVIIVLVLLLIGILGCHYISGSRWFILFFLFCLFLCCLHIRTAVNSSLTRFNETEKIKQKQRNFIDRYTIQNKFHSSDVVICWTPAAEWRNRVAPGGLGWASQSSRTINSHKALQWSLGMGTAKHPVHTVDNCSAKRCMHRRRRLNLTILLSSFFRSAMMFCGILTRGTLKFLECVNHHNKKTQQAMF